AKLAAVVRIRPHRYSRRRRDNPNPPGGGLPSRLIVSALCPHTRRSRRGGGLPMDTVANSSGDRADIEAPRSKQRSRITNGPSLFPGNDVLSVWVRRSKDVIAQHLSDKPDATAAEQAIIRRAAVLITELERLERQFALAGEADAQTLDLYGRVAGNMRRLL